MTKSEIIALETIAERIESLASLEDCGCSVEAKKEFKPYMAWFRNATYYLRKVVELSQGGDKFDKKEIYEAIQRYLY